MFVSELKLIDTPMFKEIYFIKIQKHQYCTEMDGVQGANVWL